jgi:calcium-dependent protein kinase
MLEKNPAKRPTAKQVLKHLWFKNYEANKLSDITISQDALEQLSHYHAQDKLKRTVFTYIATNMMDEEYSRDLARLFRTIDKNEDGKLSKDEIEGAYEYLGISVQDIEKIFQEVDSDSSGMIEYTEFITACFKIKGNEQKDYLSKAFEVYDVGGDGTLSITELKNGIPGIESTKWNEFLTQADQDKDGKINLNEFKGYLMEAMK